MGTRDTYQRTLLAACYILGDETTLASYLQVPPQQVLSWLTSSYSTIPTEIFLRCVDLAWGELSEERRERLERIKQLDVFMRESRLFLKEIRRRNKL